MSEELGEDLALKSRKIEDDETEAIVTPCDNIRQFCSLHRYWGTSSMAQVLRMKADGFFFLSIVI